MESKYKKIQHLDLLRCDSFASGVHKTQSISLLPKARREEISLVPSRFKWRLMAGADVALTVGVLTAGVKVWDILTRNSERRQSVDEQLAELKRDLKWLSSFLKDADAKKHTSAVVRNCVEEIKEIIYDGEDTIDRQNLGQTSGSKKSIKRLAFDVAGISKRMSNVLRDMQSFGVQQSITDGWSMHRQREMRQLRQTFPQENYESDFVGLEANVKKLVGYLVEENNVEVVSITGMGGLGKTTLARQVFNHEDVKCQFDGLAWVFVSQDFTRKNIWQKILVDLKPKEEENNILEMEESTLKGELIQLLEMSSKLLIVLDDIWKEEDWDLIKPIFPRPTKGWKVLLTSRNECVAVRRNTSYIHLKPECLNIEDSWTLFQRIAFHIKDASEFKIDEEMEEMGKQMIKHCGGLPLAIKVLGGLLAANYTRHDWKRLSENIGSHHVGGRNDSLEYVLSLSFEELPIYLKNCFLYLAHFPEDHSIDVEALSYYWAAEGIFESRHYDEETIRDVGDFCIEELVRRNMVISKRKATTLRFETCHLHDMMREICLLKAEEENFLQITSSFLPTANFQSHFIPRRFVSHNPTTLDVERDINNPKLRSLVVVFDDLCGNWKLSGSNFRRLELLRVLDLFKGEFQGGKLPYNIGELIHLRYLSLKDAKVIHLPSSLENLKLLIYLNIEVHMESIFMPNVLMGMQELRYLALPYDMHKKTKLVLSSLVKLETLKNFTTKNSSVKDLRGMVRLKTLTLKLSDKTSIETLSASIGGLRHLEDLWIQDYGRERTKKEGLVWDFVHLKKLKLRIYMPILPKEELFPSQLTTLDLFGCRLMEDPMPILEKLLHLYEVKLGDQSLCGRRMVCSSGGFPTLWRLEFIGLQEWEEWIVEEGSMPLLHTLHIWDCPKLKEVPDRLRLYEFEESIVEEGSMPLLHTLHIQDCPKLKEVLDGIRFIYSLKNLSIKTNCLDLRECRMEDDPMPILEKILHLYKVTLGDQSFCGRRMVCSSGGFPELRRLAFNGLEDWEEWIVEEGSMPLLHTLEICECPKLKELPDRLHFPSHLTTIDLHHCGLEEDPMPNLENLVQLKEVYLSQCFNGRRMVCSGGGFPQLHKLRLSNLEELEEWIVEEGSMPLLHTLEICWCPMLKELPDGQHFPSHLTTISLRSCGLEEDPMTILEKLVQLKEVRLSKCLSGKRLVCSAGGFPQLEKLYIDELEELEEWIVEEGSMPLLHSLNIRNCPKLKELPDEQHLPSHLTTISLRLCGLVEDPMPILEKLVQLEEVYLSQCFTGRRMVCSGGGFPQLQKLGLSGLDEWEVWIVEEGSMPLLHTLDIWRCPKVKELPDGLQFPSHLTTISLRWCGLEEDPMPILEKLVQLKEVILSKCFSGRRMVCSAHGFPQLQKLCLDELEELEEWIVEEGSMPLLHSLDISNCPNVCLLGRWISSICDDEAVMGTQGNVEEEDLFSDAREEVSSVSDYNSEVADEFVQATGDLDLWLSEFQQ